MKDLSVHLHLYYEDMGIYLLKKLSKIWRGEIYLSLVEDNCCNNILLRIAQNTFDTVNVTFIENKGNDQYGFYKTFQKNKDDTTWILYWHDKSLRKQDWLSELTDIFINEDNQLLLEQYTNNSSKCGIISASKHKYKTMDAEKLIHESHNISFPYRQKLVRSLQTIIWLKELEFLLKVKHDLYNEEDVYPFFTAGNIFLIRRDVLEFSHSVIHENFFENFYREDGDVGHALERFYYYVSKTMGYKNYFI